MKNRRDFLTWCASLPIIATLAVRAGAAPACVDPDELTSSEQALRNSLEYTNRSPDPKKTCGGCNFFTPGDGGCGKCQALNGPVDAKGRCSSFTPKK